MSGHTDVGPEGAAPSESAFVFVGQVLAQGAATMDAVPIDRGTFVVAVTETILSPAAVGDLAGHEITVRQETPTVEVGETYLFSADGWLFGDGLAVIARRADPYDPAVVQAARERTRLDPLAAVRSRVNDAELVVSGRVTRLSEVKRRAGEPITEHEPHWCESVIEVDTVLRSASGDSPNRVTVRFPGSQDAQWAVAPKLSIGDTGVFVLGSVAHPSEERNLSGARSGQYTLVRPEDALALEHVDELRAIIEGD